MRGSNLCVCAGDRRARRRRYTSRGNISFILLSDKEEELSELRNKYFDQQVHFKDDDKDKFDCPKNAKFLTNKKIVEGEKVYTSYAHYKKGLDSCDKVIDSSDYWEESKHFYIYEQEESG